MVDWAHLDSRVNNAKSTFTEIVKGHRKDSEVLHKMRILQAMEEMYSAPKNDKTYVE